MFIKSTGRVVIVNRRSLHYRAVAQALLVSFLWSTSIILIKIGLKDIPALTFAGLRYTLAFICLLPFAVRSGQLGSLKRLPRRIWVYLVLLGLLYYTITQGTHFLGLLYLPASTLSLVLSCTPVIVALFGSVLLAERPTGIQGIGTILYLLGILVFFYPLAVPQAEWIGLSIALIGLVANAMSSLLGRRVNRDGSMGPMAVTVVSMGVGAIVLLGVSLFLQGVPRLSFRDWSIILWLAVVNSAFAFTLWNHTLRTLSAMESSIINNTMLFQIALLAWIFLDERLTGPKIAGIILAMVGTLLVQWKKEESAISSVANLDSQER